MTFPIPPYQRQFETGRDVAIGRRAPPDAVGAA